MFRFVAPYEHQSPPGIDGGYLDDLQPSVLPFATRYHTHRTRPVAPQCQRQQPDQSEYEDEREYESQVTVEFHHASQALLPLRAR